MRKISAEELLQQVEDDVALLLASADDQLAWAASGRSGRSGRLRYPAEEIALQLYDLVGVGLRRLRDEGVADAEDERLLRDLVAYVQTVQSRLFEGIGVTDAPEWDEVRTRAELTLRSLRRPLAAKSSDHRDDA